MVTVPGFEDVDALGAGPGGFEPLAENTPVVILIPEKTGAGFEPVYLFNAGRYRWSDGDQGTSVLKTQTDPITQILGRDAMTLTFSGNVYTESLEHFLPGTDQLYHKQDAFARLRRYKRSQEPLSMQLLEGPFMGSFWCTGIEIDAQDLVLGIAQTISYTIRFTEVSSIGNTYTPPPTSYRPEPGAEFSPPVSIGPDVAEPRVYGYIEDIAGIQIPGVFTPFEPDVAIPRVANFRKFSEEAPLDSGPVTRGDGGASA